jgi:hypothetical protein
MTEPIIHQPLLRQAISTTSSSLIFLVLGFLEALWAVCVSNKSLFGEAQGKFISGLGLLATGIFEVAVAVVIRTFVGYAKVVYTVFHFSFVIIPSTYQTVLGQSKTIQSSDDVNPFESQPSLPPPPTSHKKWPSAGSQHRRASREDDSSSKLHEGEHCQCEVKARERRCGTCTELGQKPDPDCPSCFRRHWWVLILCSHPLTKGSANSSGKNEIFERMAFGRQNPTFPDKRRGMLEFGSL